VSAEDETPAQTSGSRWYPQAMGKRPEKHLLEDNPFLEGFPDCMGSPEGYSQEQPDALDQLAEQWITDLARRPRTTHNTE
jgi:hypothetical protein